ncbi:hypothetical protein [Algoriphagus sp.]|uniref:hypothetical protein n=1 Tax=Algoriphagus sp. TaxID=1872435 RepID=UPI00263025DA|nr:hypothetical protein [Algoriphagus sp.]
MKTIFTRSFLGLVISGLLFSACSQMASYENEDLQLEQAKVDKDGGFVLTPLGGGNENASLSTCGECVAEPAIQDFKTTINNNDNYADVEVWNDMENWYIKVTANESNTMEEIQLSYPFSSSLNGPNQNCNYVVDYNISFDNNGVPFTTHTFEFPLGTFEEDWNKCDLESFALRVAGISGQPVFLQGPDDTVNGTYQQGQNTETFSCEEVPTPVSYALHEICSECDEALFSYQTEDNQNITFSYNHGEEVESLTIAFTFPQVLDLELNENGEYVAPDGKVYGVNNPTNQTVFTWTGAVSCKATESETFEFSMIADCSAPQSNDGKANIWTDAKIIGINGEALVDDPETLEIDESEIDLKEDLSNIVFEGCPVN